MKKVLIITYYWPPSGGAGVQRWLKFVKYFSEFGITPIIITVDPTVAEYPQRDESLLKDVPADIKIIKTDYKNIYNYYKRFTKSKNAPYGGFANEANPTLKQKFARFIRGNFFLPDPRKGWNKFVIPKAEQLIISGETDIIITTGPPHSTHLIGLKLKQRFKNIKWIADFRDPWTDIYYNNILYQSLIAQQINKNYEKKVLEACNTLITVSPSLKRLLEKKTSKNITEKIIVIPNGYDDDDFAGLEEISPNKQFTITYTGTMADSYPIDSFLQAVQEFSDQFPIKVRFVGTISENLKNKMESALKDIVEFIAPVPHKESIEFLLQSSVLLLIIPNIIENKGILTGKLFEYIRANRPVLCLGPTDSDTSEFITECKCGKTFDYQDSAGIAKYLNEICHNKSQYNSPVKTEYSRRLLTKQLSQIILKITD